MEIARHAGMSEIATSVLHNVGNVLNSVNVSSNLICDRIRRFGASDFVQAVELIKEHQDNLHEYVTHDDRGSYLVPFLDDLSHQMADDEQSILNEINSLVRNIEHIKDIIAVQQSHASCSGLVEEVELTSLIEDAIRINIASIDRHRIRVVRSFEESLLVSVDKRKVLQVLTNLISNAKYALIYDTKSEEKTITIRLRRVDKRDVRIEVEDNGVGIPTENLTKIFNHGFTTKKDGHGFGLHMSALQTRQLGGSLLVHSHGVGRGAKFTLQFPVACPSTETAFHTQS